LFLGTQAGGGGAAISDRDWLNISDNGVPQNFTNPIYTDNYASVNVRAVWPQAQFLAGDSTTVGNVVVLGNRECRVGFYRLTGPNWSSVGQEGASLTARLGGGTTAFDVQSAAGASSSQPSAPFRNIFRVGIDSSIQLVDFKSTRNDTATIRNILYTDAQGFVKSSPVGELPPISIIAQNGHLLYFDGTSWVNSGDVKLFKNSTEQTVLFGKNILNGITYGNPKIEAVVAMGDNVAPNHSYPYASTLYGTNILTGPNNPLINSITSFGYQNLISMEEGANLTTSGTDAGYNLRKGYDSNIIGRHNFFRGDLSNTADVYRTNSFATDACETCKSVQDATIIGNYPAQTVDTLLRSYIEGSEVVRNRDEVINSILSGYQNSYSPTLSGKTLNTLSAGFRGFYNTFSTDRAVGIGALTGTLETYSTTYKTNDVLYGGESAGYNSWGDRNVFLGTRAGAFGSVRNINGAVAVGYRAGDLWLADNELAIHNTNTTTPLVYGNFSTNKLRVNGNFQVSALTTNNANTNVIVRNAGTGEFELNTVVGNNIYTGNGTLSANRTVEMAGFNLGFNAGSVNIGRTGATAPNAVLNVYGDAASSIFTQSSNTSLTAFGTGIFPVANIRNFGTGDGLVAQAENAHAFFATNAGGNNKSTFYASNTSDGMRQRTTMLLRSAGVSTVGANGDENQLVFSDENDANGLYDGAIIKTVITDATLGRSRLSVTSNSISVSSLSGTGSNKAVVADNNGVLTRTDIIETMSLLFDTSVLPPTTGITIPGLRVPASLNGWKLTECNIGVLSPAASGTDYVIRGRVNSTVTPNAVFSAGTSFVQPIPSGGGITVATGDLLKLEVVTAGTALPTGLMCTWTFVKQ
jgi:hypothetical protein